MLSNLSCCPFAVPFLFHQHLHLQRAPNLPEERREHGKTGDNCRKASA